MCAVGFLSGHGIIVIERIRVLGCKIGVLDFIHDVSHPLIPRQIIVKAVMLRHGDSGFLG